MMLTLSKFRHHAPNAIPYIIFIVLIVLLVTGTSLFGADIDPLWAGLRWLVRIVFVVGTLVSWSITAAERRPFWCYSWLGFALYEAVGILLEGSSWLVDQGPTLLVLPLLFLTFSPYFIGAIWLARRDKQLALFTIFPHAALTMPLFFFSTIITLDSSMINDIWLGSIIAVAAAGILVILIPMLQQRARWIALYGGMFLCQLLLAISIALSTKEPFALAVAIPLSILGTVILTSPLVLFPIATTIYGWVPKRQAERFLYLLRSLIREGQSYWQKTTIHNQIKNFDGGQFMTEKIEPNVPPSEQVTEPTVRQVTPPQPPMPPKAPENPNVERRLNRLYRISVVILTMIIILAGATFISRAAVYKIHEYERGLHLRGGRFVGEQLPGWHIQVPLVDTVIIVKVNERLGYVERIPAMTSDNVTMIVSLQYTYRVTEPARFALEVDDPERIVFEFVQGKLRDVVNTKAMANVMNDRALMNKEVMEALIEKEEQYGVKFVTVQMQNASPPDEVLSAIKDRMVAIQQQEQAQAEAAQQKTLADAQFYTAQTEADAKAYQITTTAQAEADSIKFKTEVQQLAIRSILEELESKGELGEKFIQYLIAQELKENSKFIIGGEGTPILDFRPE